MDDSSSQSFYFSLLIDGHGYSLCRNWRALADNNFVLVENSSTGIGSFVPTS